MLDRDPFAWTQDLVASDGVAVAHLSPSAALRAGHLPAAGFPGDPADALIYATAAEAIVPLVTKDQSLRLFASQTQEVRTIW